MERFPYNSLRTDGDFCHQARDTEIAPKNVKGVEHFLMVPLVFRFNWPFSGKKNHFLNFSQENLRP
jgi:hypothetical protein